MSIKFEAQKNKILLSNILTFGFFGFLIVSILSLIFEIPDSFYTLKEYNSYNVIFDSNPDYENQLSVKLSPNRYEDNTIIHIPFLYRKYESGDSSFYVSIVKSERIKKYNHTAESIKSYNNEAIIHFFSYKQDDGEEKILISGDRVGRHWYQYHDFNDSKGVPYVENSKVTFTIEFSVDSKKYKFSDVLVAKKPQIIKESLLDEYFLFMTQ